jgi:hypothetical protein
MLRSSAPSNLPVVTVSRVLGGRSTPRKRENLQRPHDKGQSTPGFYQNLGITLLFSEGGQTDLRLRGTDEWTEVSSKGGPAFVTTLLTSFTYDRAESLGRAALARSPHQAPVSPRQARRAAHLK